MRFLIVILMLMSAQLGTAAIVISDTPIVLAPETGGFGTPEPNYKLTVDQTPSGDYTSVWLSIEAISETQFRLQFVLSNLDDGSEWYLVNAGDSFTRTGIAEGKYPKLIDINGPPLTPRVVATVGNEFYLGVNTGVSYTEFGDYRDALGWAKLRAEADAGPFGVGLSILSNTMSYYSQGIVVGTTTVIPEPTTCALAGVALFALTALRRRK